MKFPKTASVALSLALAAALPALAQVKKQEPPAARTGLAPADRSKVTSAISRSYLRREGSENAPVDGGVLNSGSRDTLGAHNPLATAGSDCAVNVGSPAISSDTSRIGGRYGSGNADQVTVVRGSVINVCR